MECKAADGKADKQPPQKAKKTAKPAKLSEVQDAVLKDMDGNEVAASTLWADRPVLLLMLRRPGCVLCRAEARRVWALKPTMDKLGVRLVCLVHEWLPNEVTAFKPKFWRGDLFLDKEKAVYKALGGGKVLKGSWVRFFCCALCCLTGKYKEAKAIAPDSEQNVNGTHMIMGGFMLVKQGAAGVQWQFHEAFFGDHPEYDMVLEQCQQVTGQKLTEEEIERAIDAAHDAGRSKSLKNCTLNRAPVNVEATPPPEEPKKPGFKVHRGGVAQEDD